MKTYVCVTTGKSRVTVHYPELGRCVDLWTDANGRWWVRELPAPGQSGPSIEVAHGDLNETKEQ